MRILVTGGSGRIGRYVVRELVQTGHSVTQVDLASPAEHLCRFIRVDLTDAGQAYQAVAAARAEAVVHMAAWPSAGRVPDTRTYGDNVRCTFNLFQACADLGIRRVISASSAQVYGLRKGVPPLYVPLDEEHPLRPASCYALSKIAGEQAASYFSESREMTVLAFRFMGVRLPDRMRAEVEQMMQDPAGGAGLLWTRLDARDAALACRLAIEQEQVPSGVYNITGSMVVLDEMSSELVRRYWGEEIEVHSTLAGHDSPLSCARAEAAFGFRPRFVWTASQQHPEI